MRILLLSHYYPPETHGGTQGHVARLAHHLATAGHEVAVVAGASTSADPPRVERTDEDGITVTRLFRDHGVDRLSGDMGSDWIRARIDEIARGFKPDIAHVHHWHALTRDVTALLKGHGARVVITLHDLFTSCPRHFRMPDARRFCDRDVTLADCAACVHPDVSHLGLAELEDALAARFEALQAELETADRVFCVSEAQRTFLQSLPRFRFEGLDVSPIGIPRDDRPPPTAPDEEDEPLRLVNWAGLDPRKGAHVLVEAVAGSDRCEGFEVHFWGKDGEREYMDELRSAAGPARVWFHGPYEDDARRTFAADNHFAVFPFLAFETYGLVVDEALALGLPVIVSDRGAPHERVGGRGRVVRADDPEALRDVLEHLLDHPEEIADMRTAAHGARNLEEHVKAIVDVYHSLV